MSVAKPNHGSAVSTYVHELQDARVDGEHPGIGQLVSEFARNSPPPPPDFQDGVITVVKDEGGVQVFSTFQAALAFANDGDTLQVGAGVYGETIELDERVTIVGEAGAVLDGSGVVVSPGVQATVELFDGFSGGSISGLEIVAVQGGNAVVSIIGQAVEGIRLTDNVFDADDNTAGPLVYLNPGAKGVVIEGNSFEGDALSASPLLGVEADNVQVRDNAFGDTPETYAKVEVFAGPNGTTADVVLTGNIGLDSNDVVYI